MELQATLIKITTKDWGRAIGRRMAESKKKGKQELRIRQGKFDKSIRHLNRNAR
jgi:hypothetical protein